MEESQKGKSQRGNPHTVSFYISEWSLNHMWETHSEQLRQRPTLWTKTRFATRYIKSEQMLEGSGGECTFTGRTGNSNYLLSLRLLAWGSLQYRHTQQKWGTLEKLWLGEPETRSWELVNSENSGGISREKERRESLNSIYTHLWLNLDPHICRPGFHQPS